MKSKKSLIVIGIVVFLLAVVLLLSRNPEVQNSFEQGQSDAQRQLDNNGN